MSHSLPDYAVESRLRICEEQLGEKALHQILRVMRAMTLPSNVCVKGKPVNAAQLFQRLGRLRRHAFTRRQHDTPMRGGELSYGSGNVIR